MSKRKTKAQKTGVGSKTGTNTTRGSIKKAKSSSTRNNVAFIQASDDPSSLSNTKSSTTKNPTELDVPVEWTEALGILNEAHLPSTLPVKWEKTESGLVKIAFDPISGKKYDLELNRFVKPDTYPVRFITLTKGQHSIPGSEAPAAVRYQRYMEEDSRGSLVQNERGEWYAPCIAHGDYVKVESLQADHLQAKIKITKRQTELVEKLNDDPHFAEFLMQQAGMDKFFIKVFDTGIGREIYYGTLFFYELYFNDIDNIWLICQACNLHKSDDETVNWLKKQWLYGQEFLDYLERLDPQRLRHVQILDKIKNREGLAQVTIEWFWDRHAHYMLTNKRLFENVKMPLQILSQKIDRVIGEGSDKRAERLKASFDFKLILIEEIAKAKGLGLPRGTSESLHPSSDTDEYLPVVGPDGKMLRMDRASYNQATTEFLPGFISLLQNSVVTRVEEIESGKLSKRI
ncbi:MAG: hypothetical protein JSS53_06970 [Proteobacteria bacterium]|nr:hypothetical protein [Pseudomonadota bacterium]